MDYGSLLRRSWDIVWNNKFMFVLGFLAALGGGGSNGGGGGRTNYDVGSGDFTGEGLEQFRTFWAQYGALMIGLICAAVIVSFILWLIRLTAQTGMIESVSRIEAGEKVTFGEAFSAGTAKLGRMVGVNVVMYGPFTLLGLITFGVGAATFGTAVAAGLSGASSSDIEALFGGMGIAGICAACLGCLLIPLLIVVTTVYPFAQRGAVLQDLGVIDSIRHGWQIVKNNVSDIILLIILFIVLSVVFGLVAMVVLLPFALVALGPGFFSLIVNEGSFGVTEIALLAGGGICVGLVGAAVNSILTAFRSTAVTLAYQEFVNK
ncbi:MAG: hypothetical protein GY803_06705 [Chloroflexi bacterium]|nr:hypothetical protein [Chloroflexota bacterium]